MCRSVPGTGEVRRGFRFAHHLSPRAHLDEAHALGSAQRVVVFALEPVLAHKTAETHHRKPVRGALGFRDFADVADEVCYDPRVRIVALGLRLDEQSGNRDAALLERGDDPERCIAEDESGLVRRLAGALQHALDFGAVDVRNGCDARERGAEVRLGTGQQRYRVARDVLGDYVTSAVVDDASWRGERNRPQPVRLRLQLILAVPEDLRAEE